MTARPQPLATQAQAGADEAQVASGGRIEALAAVVGGWWARRAARAGLEPGWRASHLALGRFPFELGTEVDPRLLDASPFALGEAYVCGLDASERMRHGRHYTPHRLTRSLWDQLRRAGLPDAGEVFDPAAGAGALLLEEVRRLVRRHRATDAPEAAIPAIAARVSGRDLDSHAVWLGNAVLAAELLPLWARIPAEQRRPLPRLLDVGDGLEVASGEARAVTILNPPYGKVRLDPDMRARWAHTLYGHANRYGLFLAAAVERTAPGGLIGAVVPTGFLGGAYFQNLRATLATHAPLERLVLIDERDGVFASGVLQETCLAVFRRRTPNRSRIAVFRQAGERPARHVATITEKLTDRPWLLPRQSGDRTLVRAAGRLTNRLTDFGWKASTGPLVWNRHRDTITPRPADGTIKILWAADFDQRGVAPDRARDRQRYLRPRDRERFMVLDEPAVLVQRTTAPEQPRRLVAAVLDPTTLEAWGGAVIVENHVNVLRGPEGPLTRELVAGLLNTETLDRLFRCLSGTVAVSAYELESLPLPDLDELVAWLDLDPEELAAAVAERYR